MVEHGVDVSLKQSNMLKNLILSLAAVPMRGIPRSMSGPGMLRTTVHTPSRPRPLQTHKRKDGGIKLLDINESPIAAQQVRLNESPIAAQQVRLLPHSRYGSWIGCSFKCQLN